MNMEGLFIGAVVHSVHHLGGGRYRCEAALVTDLFDARTGNINVREMGNLQLRSCLSSAGGEGGTWHWPEQPEQSATGEVSR